MSKKTNVLMVVVGFVVFVVATAVNLNRTNRRELKSATAGSPLAPITAPAKFLIGDSMLYDPSPEAAVPFARRTRSAGTRFPELVVNLASGDEVRLSNEEADALWRVIAFGATPVPMSPQSPLPAPPFPPPPPADVPPGFGPTPPTPPATIPWGMGPVVEIGREDYPGAIVILMVGRTGVPEFNWVPHPQGQDVYLLGMDTRAQWSAVVNGVNRELNVDERGYAWLFARSEGPFRLEINSRAKPAK